MRSYFIEMIGNANEDVIRKYVEDQPKVMSKSEENSKQLRLLKNSVACGRVF